MAEAVLHSARTREPLQPFDRLLPSSKLNVEEKSRANLFAWRGQFTPQLVEALLKAYSLPNSFVLDPFAGSGTVLLEAGRLGLPAAGFELNPAAALLAQTYTFINLDREVRLEHLRLAEQALKSFVPETLPLFNGKHTAEGDSIEDQIPQAIDHAETIEAKRLLETFAIVIDFAWRKGDASKVWNTWPRLRTLVKNLPISKYPIHVGLADARRLPLPGNSVDFVLTSPPYINVFNYHQNYRASAEALGWKPLKVARSEIGSNRKFRQNRFLTVVQYCIDLALVLHELRRICKPDARIIFVVGRESNVRKTAFYNGQILARLASEAAGYELVLSQERVFSNKFGQNIYEDILHLKRTEDVVGVLKSTEVARDIALQALINARDRAPHEVLEDLEDAIQKVDAVNKSSIFNPELAGSTLSH